MPCNMLAVAQMALHTDFAEEVFNVPDIITAVQLLMAQTLGVEPALVTMFGSSAAWHTGYHQWRAGQPITQVELDTLIGGKELYWVAERLAVKMTASGEITFRDGWDLNNPLNAEELAGFQAEFEALLVALGIGIAQERVVAAIAQVGEIISDEWDNDMNRVLKVSI